MLSKQAVGAIERAPTERAKMAVAAGAMVETPLALIRAVLLKREEAVLEVMRELHQQQQRALDIDGFRPRRHRSVQGEKQMNIIELAREADLHLYPDWLDGALPDAVERFAALVRAAALEEAAQKCEDVSFDAMNEWKLHYKTLDQGRELGADECATAIRALKEKT